MKRELIEERAGEIFSEYTLGPHFIDFCRGPHVPSTSQLKAFKLLSIAGAYWKGDEHNPQLQRIYGTAFFSKKDLDAYLDAAGRSQEARPSQARPGAGSVQHPGTRRPGPDLLPSQGRHHPQDHRRLDARSVSGARLFAGLHAARDAAAICGRPPGHANFYSDNMFKPMELDDAEYQLKPMNCPGHILIYADKQHSYRDLPVRLGELGTVYRYERSGVHARPAARARLHAGRRAHLLHAGTDRRRSRELPAVRHRHAEHLSASTNTKPSFPPGTAARAASTTARRSSGSWPKTRCKRATERLNMKVKVMPGRSGVLRPQDRREAGGRHRPAVAAFHRAVRFHAAAPLRARIHRRRRQEASAADGASRAVSAPSSASSAS